MTGSAPDSLTFDSRSAFISYCRADGTASALELVAFVRPHGIAVFLDSERTTVEDDFHHTIYQALWEEVDCMVVLVTPQTASSRWVLYETLVAESAGCPIIAHVVDDAVELPWFLCGSGRLLARSREELLDQILTSKRSPTNQSRRLWNLSTYPSPHHVGRESVLRSLQRRFEETPTGVLVQVIAGLGGVGKTQLALHYVVESHDRYRAVWWIRADSSDRLKLDYSALAEHLEVPSSADTAQKVWFVRSWLQHNAGWLLVFDDANRYEDIEPFLPEHGSGHVVVTSRQTDWPMCVAVELNEFSEEEAVQFLESRTELPRSEWMEKLVARLGALPLALSQAGAFLKQEGISIRQYLDLLSTRSYHAFAEGQVFDTQKRVASTWDVTMDRVVSQYGRAAELLEALAFLSPTEAPVELLSGFLGDEEDVVPALRTMARYSMLRLDRTTVSVHPMVQEITRLRLSHKAAVIVRLAQLADKLLPTYSSSLHAWAVARSLLPHATSVCRYARDEFVEDKTTVRLQNKCGLYLYSIGSLKECDEFQTAALNGVIALGGVGTVVSAALLNNLARAKRAVGDLDQARSLFERALEVLSSAEEIAAVEIAASKNNLAGVLEDLGEFEYALALYRESCAIREKHEPKDHEAIGESLNNLGLAILNAKGDVAEATDALERALAHRTQALGGRHPFVGETLDNMGLAKQAVEDFLEAEILHRSALRIFEENLGDSHLSIGKCLNNLAMCRLLQGGVEDALKLAHRALTILEEQLGRRHWHVGDTHLLLSQIHEIAGDERVSAFHRRQGLDISNEWGRNAPGSAS